MDFHKIKNQGNFWIQRVSDISVINHTASDEGRFVYSMSDDSVYVGTSTEFLKLSVEYSLISSGAKMLFGSYPLPVGWNITNFSSDFDAVVSITNVSNDINKIGGTWTITGMNDSSDHDHTGYTDYSDEVYESRWHWDDPPFDFSGSAAVHRHSILSDGVHSHTFDGNWRPYYIYFAEGTYQ